MNWLCFEQKLCRNCVENHGSRCYNFGMRKLLLILLLLLPINAFSLSREEAKQKLSSDLEIIEGIWRVEYDGSRYHNFGTGTEILIISDGGKNTYDIYSIYSKLITSGTL